MFFGSFVLVVNRYSVTDLRAAYRLGHHPLISVFVAHVDTVSALVMTNMICQSEKDWIVSLLPGCLLQLNLTKRFFLEYEQACLGAVVRLEGKHSSLKERGRVKRGSELGCLVGAAV